MKQTKLVRYLTAFLIVLSLVLTTGTFAYWVGNVEGTDSKVEDTLTIGSGKTVTTQLTIDQNDISDYGQLVPSKQINNSINLAVDMIPLNYSLKWFEEQSTSQIYGEEIYGIIKTSIRYEIIPINESDVLDYLEYSNIYNLVNIEENENNQKEITLNDDTPKNLQYVITLAEPSNQSEYQIIKNAVINFYFTFEIVLNDYDLDLNFVEMSQTDLDRVSIQALNQNWTTDKEQPLDNYRGEERIFFPISRNDYTVTVQANLSEINSSGGYGIMFDTVFEADDPNKDSGYIFQFDRGFADGEMIVRPRSWGGEFNPIFTINHSEGNLFPSEKDNPEWWTEIHEITINVTTIKDSTREATFYLDGTLLGSIQYEFEASDQQLYVGLRGWGWTTTNFYSLNVR